MRPTAGPAPAAGLPQWVLWVEHEPAYHLFQSMGTQWRYGTNGPTGLDYAGVRASPQFRRLARDQRELVFEDVCIVERAWLVEKHERAARYRDLPSE